MVEKILITGGAGFIGSRLANELILNGCEVSVIDSLTEQVHGKAPENSTLYLSLPEQVRFIRGDVCCQKDLEKALEGIDIVVHLAAETGTGQSMYSIRQYCDVNISGTALLLDLIVNKQLPIKRLIVASSRAVYGEGTYFCEEHGNVNPNSRIAEDMQKGNFDVHCPFCSKTVKMLATKEDAPLKPASIYGITKLNQEQMVLMLAKSMGISAIAFRYQNVYGPGQSLNNPYTGILSIFSSRIKNGKSINIFEDGKESRDFVYIDDVVRATVAGILHKEPLIEVFNVGSGETISVEDVVMNLGQLLNHKVSAQISGQFRLGDIRHNLADLSKIRNILGYEPLVNFSEGLGRFVNWAQNETIFKDSYETSILELKSKGLLK